MAQLPHMDIHSPIIRFRKEQVERFAGHAGIVGAIGRDEAADGTYGTIRLIFTDENVMNQYLAAGLAALVTRSS